MKTFSGNDVITAVAQQFITPDQVKAEEGKQLKNKYLSHFFGFVIGIGLLALGYFTSESITLIFGAFCMLFMILATIQMLIQRRVATMMKTQDHSAASITNIHDRYAQPGKATNIPPFQLDVYEQNELPDHNHSLNPALTEQKNIFGIEPLRIFYFFNFYSTSSLLNKTGGGFQRHGPLFYLGSPQDIGFLKIWHIFSISKIMRKLLLTSPAELTASIDKASLSPLPAKTKGLMAENYITGAYPSNVFYCTDAIWQQCVAVLFSKTTFAIIDASDYTAERAGLQWEIGQIINHVATERFIVFINSKTDIVALAESFRTCWAQMNADSPNNKEKAMPVRFIFNQWPDRRRDNNFHKNVLLAQYHEQTLSNDNVVDMLLRSKPFASIS